MYCHHPLLFSATLLRFYVNHSSPHPVRRDLYIWYVRDVPISVYMRVDHRAPSFDDVLPMIRNGDLTAPKHVEVVDLTWTEPEELSDSLH